MPNGTHHNYSRQAAVLVVGLSLLLSSLALFARPNYNDARDQFLKGQYLDCLRACTEARELDIPGERWPLLTTQAQLMTGLYPDATNTVLQALSRYQISIRLRLLAHEALTACGDLEGAQRVLNEINELGSTYLRSYQDPPNLVALGKGALLLGADPKLVLTRFFEPAMKADPEDRDTHLASGDLALSKEDDALAGEVFGKAVQQFPEDADMHYGLARAFANSDPEQTQSSIERALELNPRHLPSHLLLVDHAINAEQYEAAQKQLDYVLEVNPWHPEAWAYKALIAHLTHDVEGEQDARAKAFHYWPTNPKVDHLIGRKLSQNYRFEEGARHQRRALMYDSSYLPAYIQLAQDLLRLGHEEEGWDLARSVHEHDGYNVTAFNLANLHDTMAEFATVTNEVFILRMSRREQELYGDRVLALLDRAAQSLCTKYGLELEQPVTIEIFPEQKDFAVRTFGMPGNPGYLGVCFGNVITANSPASRAATPHNWEAILWHEFAHVVTLNLTRNKIPRWLSEGISVYEERQANPIWGEQMNPRYRSMILEGETTPISELSGAFLRPESPVHLQFAYYQSSLVVEFLVEEYGFDALKQVLKDLDQGETINAALAARTAPLDTLEKDFEAFARTQAETWAANLDWTRPDEGRDRLTMFLNLPSVDDIAEDTPSPSASDAESTAEPPTAEPASTDLPNYYALLREGANALADRRFSDAKAPLRKVIELCPHQTGSESAYALLAAAHQGLGETEQEIEVLREWTAVDPDATEAFLQLMRHASDRGDMEALATNALKCLAVDPLLPHPHRALAEAGGTLGDNTESIKAWERVLLLDPMDPARVHYELAKLLHAEGSPRAQRHVLQALEEAPRFRDAHSLLLEIHRQQPPAESEPSTDTPVATP